MPEINATNADGASSKMTSWNFLRLGHDLVSYRIADDRKSDGIDTYPRNRAEEVILPVCRVDVDLEVSAVIAKARRPCGKVRPELRNLSSIPLNGNCSVQI